MSMKMSETMLIWAFRYCLGRRSYAVSDCVMEIIHNWGRLHDSTQQLIIKEIQTAFVDGSVTGDSQKQEWERILALAEEKPIE